jgi:hypothetical protein
MADELRIERAIILAESDHGVSFGVGQVGERWVGFARGTSRDTNTEELMEFVFLFGEVSEGVVLPGTAIVAGVATQTKALALTIKALTDPRSPWGPVEWYIDETIAADVGRTLQDLDEVGRLVSGAFSRGNPPCFLEGESDGEERNDQEETGDEESDGGGEQTQAGGVEGDQREENGGDAGPGGA